MFSLSLQEKLRKPIIGIGGLMNKTGMASAWLRFVSASYRFIIWRSPFIKSLKADYIIDIGANSGEFAMLARAAFPSAKIVSFEPQSEAFSSLNKAMGKDAHFQSYQVALGETEGTAIMHIADFSPSSSFMIASAGSVPQEIAIQQLDSFENLLEAKYCTIVKMDVEGYELAILKGGKKFIAKSDYIYIECRTTETIGCAFSEIYDFLIRLGWEYQGAYDSVFSSSGKLQYFDALFKNLNKPAQ